MRIAAALEPFDPFWYEDPVRMDSLAALSDYASKTRVPICVSETLSGKWEFRELLETGSLRHRDARRHLVRRADRGPQDLVTGRDVPSAGGSARLLGADRVHGLRAPVAQRRRTRSCRGQCRALRTPAGTCELVTQIPDFENGWIHAPGGAGASGRSCSPDLHRRKDAHVVVSRA